jgi:hypothetical protein
MTETQLRMTGATPAQSKRLGLPSGIPCQPVCGDNVRKGSEQCDPPGVGCSASCRTAAGYDCSSGSCVLTVCGNGNAANPVGAAQAGEGCDDGNSSLGMAAARLVKRSPHLTRVAPQV